VRLSDFDYHLPEELIAQEPAEQRDKSRLMVLYRNREKLEHRTFKDLLEYLNPGDALVLNDTKVIPARLLGTKEGGAAPVEVLLLSPAGHCRWEALVRPGRRVPVGARLEFGGGLLNCRVVDKTRFGGRVLDFGCGGILFDEILEQVGVVPLPPYIKKLLADKNRYQTVYARQAGSVAAPTAGLHFTPELLAEIVKKKVTVVPVLLHVGLGTFRPVRVDNIREHHMHAEYYRIAGETAEALARCRCAGGRVIAVGTTTSRCLESAADADGKIRAGEGCTDLFIYPGYRFKAVDVLLTNFHLPRSTLLMMVSAFAGREKILNAYREAVDKRYRFFSFGDAMLII